MLKDHRLVQVIAKYLENCREHLPFVSKGVNYNQLLVASAASTAAMTDEAAGAAGASAADCSAAAAATTVISIAASNTSNLYQREAQLRQEKREVQMEQDKADLVVLGEPAREKLAAAQ